MDLKIETATQYLEAAQTIIKDEARWCRKAIALQKDGKPCLDGFSDSKAFSFCSIGVIALINRRINRYDLYIKSTNYLIEAFKEANPKEPMTVAQDMMTHGEVIRTWDRAIDLSKGEK